MQRADQKPDFSNQSGFTLVELLVAMGIFIILASLTVAGFRANSADRVGAAAGSFKNSLEGARSRAISSGVPRGIRLIPDPDNGRVVRSFVYLSGPTLFGGEVRLQFVPYPGTPDPYRGRWVVSSEPIDNPANSRFEQLHNRGLLASGTRLEIPTDSGNWYTLYRRLGPNRWELFHNEPNSTKEMYHNYDTYLPLPNDDPSLVRSYHPLPYEAEFRRDPANAFFQHIVPNCIVSESLPFRIKLQPTILPGSEPTMLPEGVGIDLDGSELPGIFVTWRPDLDDPYPNHLGTPDPDFYSPQMDIMFSPRGTLQGAQQSQGILNFRFAYLDDIELDRSLGARPLHRGSNVNFVVRANPQRDHRVVSIYTETGQGVISEIDPTDDGDGIADHPFRFVVLGREAK